MFKPFLLLPVCVALFLFFQTSLLYAGVIPPKSTDLTVKSLKDENPKLWSALGLDALGDDGTVLHLADNSGEILLEILQEVINSLPYEHISFEDITDSLAGESDSQPDSQAAIGINVQGRSLSGNSDQTSLQPRSSQTVFHYYIERTRQYYIQIRQRVTEPLMYRYNQVGMYLQQIIGYCNQFLEQHCSSLFYNQRALIGRGPAVDPAVFPARWLQIREIRDHLLQQWIRINSRYFASRIRRFDNLQLPAHLNWQNVAIRGFSFQGAVITGHIFSYCKLVDTNLKGTRFYRCHMHCSEISGVQTDLQTQLQTSTFQHCANRDTITTLLAVTGAQNTDDSSWQGLVHRMINIYFINQLQQHAMLQQMVAALTSGQVSEFIEHSQALISLYPELFSVALQVMYIVSMQNKEMAPYRSNIQLLMSLHAADALALLSACNQADGEGAGSDTGVMLNQVQWPETPVTLTTQQLDYQSKFMNYMQQHQLQPVTIPKDDQCFYHVLAQHVADTNPNLTQEDKKKRADLLRQMIASYLFVYMINLFAQDELGKISVDGVMQTKMNVLNNILREGQLDLVELLDTAAEAAHPTGWAGQTTVMVAAIVLGQPVFMVNDHGSNVHVSLMNPDGTSVYGNDAEAAIQTGEVQNVIPIAFDSVNHWFTMVGAVQTWVVQQGQPSK